MNVLDYLRNSENKFSKKIAIEDEFESVTYHDLKQRTESIGTAIAEKIADVNRPVVVFIDRNAASVCAFLGIVQSHNFYVPVDAAQPIERIKVIFSQIQPALVISVHNNVPNGLELGDLPLLEYDEIYNHSINCELLAERQKDLIDTDPLYAICTSGSTGVPKGVLISHRSVLDFIPVFTKTFGLSSDDVFGNQAPFDFDVSVKDIYSSLYLGSLLSRRSVL